MREPSLTVGLLRSIFISVVDHRMSLKVACVSKPKLLSKKFRLSNRTDPRMKNFSLNDCIEFQNCFLHDGKFSPFENVGDFRVYFPRVLIGEIGGLINLHCKLRRSCNKHDDEIEDECVDMFIYLLLLGRMLEIHDGKQVLGSIRECWNAPITPLASEEDLYQCLEEMIWSAFRLLKPGKELCYNETFFQGFFFSVQRVSEFVTSQSWQHLVNKFHQQVIEKHTAPMSFSFDGAYRGSFMMDIGHLLALIDKIEIKLPQKRIEFLARVNATQSIYFPGYFTEPHKSKTAGV